MKKYTKAIEKWSLTECHACLKYLKFIVIENGGCLFLNNNLWLYEITCSLRGGLIMNFNIVKRSILICILAVFVLAALFAGGCAQPETTSPRANGEVGEPAAQEYEPVELNMCHFMPPMHPLHTNVLVPFAEEVAEKTQDRVKIFVYAANELAAADKNYDATLSGVIDIGLTLPAYTPGMFPLTTILEFPFMFTSPLQSNLAAWELFTENPVVRDTEYKDVEVLWWGTTDLGHFLMKKPVKTVEDLHGKKVRSPSTVGNDVLAALEAVPVSLPVSDTYDAIERAIVDGTMLPISTLISFNLSDVVDHVLVMNMYATPLHMVVNKTSWGKISPEDQGAIKELLEAFPKEIGEQYVGEDQAGYGRAEEKGIAIDTPSPEELQKFHDAMDPLVGQWIEEYEAKGIPAQEVYEQLKSIAKKYE